MKLKELVESDKSLLEHEVMHYNYFRNLGEVHINLRREPKGRPLQ